MDIRTLETIKEGRSPHAQHHKDTHASGLDGPFVASERVTRIQPGSGTDCRNRNVAREEWWLG